MIKRRNIRRGSIALDTFVEGATALIKVETRTKAGILADPSGGVTIYVQHEDDGTATDYTPTKDDRGKYTLRLDDLQAGGYSVQAESETSDGIVAAQGPFDVTPSQIDKP